MERFENIPALYLIPTGLSDAAPADVIPDANIEIMKGLRYFIVENLRTARRWIRKCDSSFDFDGVEFFELNTHTAPEEVARMLQPLRNGNPMGVMSEAGCPAVADPGADVVAIAQREGLRVVPLVGPSSILMGLMGSGFNGQQFCFHGYLPIDEKEKIKTLRMLERESGQFCRTQIFIETPYRNNRMLALMTETLMADTKICVASDITSPEESILTKTCSEWKKINYDYSKKPTIFLIYRGTPDEPRRAWKEGGRRK